MKESRLTPLFPVPLYTTELDREFSRTELAFINKTRKASHKSEGNKISNNSYSLFPELCKVFVHNQFISSVVDNFFGIPNNKGLQTFSTWEYKNSNADL